MNDDKYIGWVNTELLKSAFGGQLAIFCNRHGNMACMHFMKDFKCERNFYCLTEIFDNASRTGTVIEMVDDFDNKLRVYPAGYHNYNSFFNVADLISAGVMMQEIDYLCKNNKIIIETN